MSQTSQEIKAMIEEMSGSGLSSTARLVAVLEAVGVTDRADLERLTDSKPSTLREARRALEIQRQKSSSAGNPAPEIQRCAGNPAVERQKSSALTCNEQKEIPPTPPKEKTTSPRTTVEHPTNIGARSKSTPRGARLDANWSLPDEWREWTRISFATASAEQIALEADKFRDYWHAKPGATACKLDWQATWRNWCRTALAPTGRQQTLNWGRNAYDQRKAAELPKRTVRQALNDRIAARQAAEAQAAGATA